MAVDYHKHNQEGILAARRGGAVTYHDDLERILSRKGISGASISSAFGNNDTITEDIAAMGVLVMDQMSSQLTSTSQGLEQLSEALGDPSQITEMLHALNTMISEDNETYYINSNTTEQTKNQTGEDTHPFKTIQQAILAANKRKFVGSSSLTIYLLSDITISGKDVLSIYHPDLIQNKKCSIIGRKGNVENEPVTINFTGVDPNETDATKKRNRYSSVFTIYCNTHFQNITFKGDCENYGNFLSHKVYTFQSQTTETVQFTKCTFIENSTCFSGAGLYLNGRGTIDNTEQNKNVFENCGSITDFSSGKRSEVEGGLVVKNCLQGFNVNGSNLRLWTNYPGTIDVENVSKFVTGVANGSILFQLQYTGNGYIGDVPNQVAKPTFIFTQTPASGEPQAETWADQSDTQVIKAMAQLLVGETVTIDNVTNDGVVVFSNPNTPFAFQMQFVDTNDSNMSQAYNRLKQTFIWRH